MIKKVFRIYEIKQKKYERKAITEINEAALEVSQIGVQLRSKETVEKHDENMSSVGQ